MSNEVATEEFTVVVHDYWSSFCCQGSASLRRGDEASSGNAGALEVLGRELPAGSRVRVTVEVLEETAPRTECGNPWHTRHSHRRDEEQGHTTLPIPAWREEERRERDLFLEKLRQIGPRDCFKPWSLALRGRVLRPDEPCPECGEIQADHPAAKVMEA